jgi:O-antigen ligase
MKLARALSEAEAKKVQTFVLLGGVFTTLTIWTKLEDPINLPKMFVLVIFAAGVIGLSLPSLLNFKKIVSKNQQISLLLIGLFIFGISISTFMTDVKHTAIFGEYHRNNGYLSYFAMALLMASSILVFNLKGFNRYFNYLASAGFLLTSYGFLQGMGKDPAGWKIDYNPYITTLGNPNFTSGFLGISGIAIFYLLITTIDPRFKVLFAVTLLGNLYILYQSGSVQGFFSFAIGVSVIVLVKGYLVSKTIGNLGALIALAGSIPILLAVFNIGPLASKLYQGTLRNRLDYWNSALSMFRDFPISGVGIDRFGEYYREYALQNQLVREQVTNNAHSVYLQLLSTGGLLTFLPYLALVLFVSFVGFRALFKAQGMFKLQLSGIFGIWLGSLILNIVTIDNLGVGIWFWITGGVLIAVSSPSDSKLSDISKDVKRPDKYSKKLKDIQDTNSVPAQITAFIFLLSALILMVPQLNKSSSLFNLKDSIGPVSSESYVGELVATFEMAGDDPQFIIQLANLALRQNATDAAIKMIDKVNNIDSRSYYGKYFAAVVYENKNDFAKANSYRQEITKIDPWNTKNLLQMLKNYLALGDRDSASNMALTIAKIYPDSAENIEASTLLSN